MTKKLNLILFVLLLVLAMSGCTQQETTATEPTATLAEYTVTIQTAGGMTLPDVDVYIYEPGAQTDLAQYGKTSETGTLAFSMADSGNYSVVLSGVPEGYALEDSYSFTDRHCNITLTSALIPGESLSGATLGLGDVMYDFTVTTPDGEKLTLSKMLEEKEMVLLNFWYTTCSWCVKEFPYMQQAYDTFQDQVGIIALNPMEEDPAIASFQNSYGLTFPMAKCPAAWSAALGLSGYPTSIVVDRYGVICLIEAGGITSLRPFTSMFDHFTAEDYQQSIYSSLSELVTAAKPNVEMESSDAVSAVLDGGTLDVTYRPEEGKDAEYSWPFIITEKNGEACLKASNQGIEGSYSILYADIYLEAGQALGLDYLTSTEKGADILHVIVNDEAVFAISGYNEVETWQTCYPWVAKESGDYEVALCYIKDGDTNEADDTVYLKNLRVVDSSKISVPTYIPRNAATAVDDLEYEYVDIVLSEADGYYHVGSKDGPLLLADLMGYTQFHEEKSVWEMVYNGDISVGGYNYYDDMVSYFSYASNSALNGSCTVNQELADWLTLVDSIAGFDENDDLEWLKCCKYYDVYGTDAQLSDPIQGLATFCPFEATLGSENYFYYDRPIMPRGLLAEFVPEQSGVYRITSHSDSEQGVEGWIFSGDDRDLNYTYEHSERLWADNKNVSMVYYMEAGKPYYIDIAFWDIYETGYIYYDIEYIGPEYDLFRICSPGYFTYDTNATGDQMYALIAGGVDVVLGEDGYYYVNEGTDPDGNQKYGSLIYCDFTGITGVFSNPITTVDAYNEDGTVQKNADGTTVKIRGMIDLGGFDFSKTENDLYILSILEKYDQDVEAADAYLREYWGEDYNSYADLYQLKDVYKGKYHGSGEDLTGQMQTYLDDIITQGSTELIGCVPVTKDLAQILQLLMDKYTFQNVDHSWTKLCYYYQYLGPMK